jgi:hypothetical protein
MRYRRMAEAFMLFDCYEYEFENALPFFISGSSIEGACKEAEISRETYYEWMKQPLFKSELEGLRNEVVSDAIGNLQHYYAFSF